MLLFLAGPAYATDVVPSAHIAEPGFQCHFETRGNFGAFSASFDVPRSGAPPRGSVQWQALHDSSFPALLGAEWLPSRTGQYSVNDGQARITAPLPSGSDEYVDLFVRSDPDSKFANPQRINSQTMLWEGGGGLVHARGTNDYFFNAAWHDIVGFSRRHSVFYVFGVRDLPLNRAVILARFKIDSRPFIQADKRVRVVLNKAARMLANPVQYCSAVDDLPPGPIIVTGGLLRRSVPPKS
jgi:hypothetical protein